MSVQYMSNFCDVQYQQFHSVYSYGRLFWLCSDATSIERTVHMDVLYCYNSNGDFLYAQSFFALISHHVRASFMLRFQIMCVFGFMFVSVLLDAGKRSSFHINSTRLRHLTDDQPAFYI